MPPVSAVASNLRIAAFGRIVKIDESGGAIRHRVDQPEK
jgi:hypothetical protein